MIHLMKSLVVAAAVITGSSDPYIARIIDSEGSSELNSSHLSEYGGSNLLPISVLRPSQDIIGHALIGEMIESRKNLTHAEYQEELLQEVLPVVIGPDGSLFLLDGHHRITTAVLKKNLEKDEDEYYFPAKIEGNYLGIEWKDFAEFLIKSRSLFISKNRLNPFLGSLSEADSTSIEKSWENLLQNQMPKSFSQIGDDALRSLLGKIFYDANLNNTGNCFSHFFELFLGEILANKIDKFDQLTQECFTWDSEWKCTQADIARSDILSVLINDEDVKSWVSRSVIVSGAAEATTCLNEYYSRLRLLADKELAPQPTEIVESHEFEGGVNKAIKISTKRGDRYFKKELHWDRVKMGLSADEGWKVAQHEARASKLASFLSDGLVPQGRANRDGSITYPWIWSLQLSHKYDFGIIGSFAYGGPMLVMGSHQREQMFTNFIIDYLLMIPDRHRNQFSMDGEGNLRVFDKGFAFGPIYQYFRNRPIGISTLSPDASPFKMSTDFLRSPMYSQFIYHLRYNESELNRILQSKTVQDTFQRAREVTRNQIWNSFAPFFKVWVRDLPENQRPDDSIVEPIVDRIFSRFQNAEMELRQDFSDYHPSELYRIYCEWIMGQARSSTF